MQMEHAGLISIALHPGWARTDMGNFAAQQWGFAPGPPDSVEDCVRGVLSVVDAATREKSSGRFITQTGVDITW